MATHQKQILYRPENYRATTILASLPSSRDFRPANSSETHGCVEVAEACFNCYVFKGGFPVTTHNWAFPLDTFVYGQQIDEYEIATLQDIYPLQGLDYKILGRLKDAEFQQFEELFRSICKCKTSVPKASRYRLILNFEQFLFLTI
jgi:hypothetical protein